MQRTSGRDRRRRGQAGRWLAWLIPCLALVGACRCHPDERQAAEQQAGDRELVVFAAASLRDAFEALGEGFRQTHGHDIRVTFHFAGSQQVRTQIEHGAVADVFASANRKHVDALARQGLVRPGAIFARNQLAVVVPEGAARGRTFRELPAAERVVIGAPEVPIGKYTRQLLARAEARWPGFQQRVMERVVSQELHVRQVLTRVTLGEAGAGVVYRTDAAAAAGQVDVVPIPEDLNVVAAYPIAVLAEAPHPVQAADWIAYVRSAEGQRVLARFGFAPPAAGQE